MFDSKIGRFFSVDRFKNKYPYYSSYLFAGNMPIHAVDIQGDSVWVVSDYDKSVDKNGKTTIIITHKIHLTQKILDLTGKVNASDLAGNVTVAMRNAIDNSGESIRVDNDKQKIIVKYRAGTIAVRGVGSMKDVEASDHLSVIVDDAMDTKNPDGSRRGVSGWGLTPGKVNYIEPFYTSGGFGCSSPTCDYGEMAQSIVHETGHNFGLGHPLDEKGRVIDTGNNAMSYSPVGQIFSVNQFISDEFRPTESNKARNFTHAKSTTNNLLWHTSTNEKPWLFNVKKGDKIPLPIRTPEKSKDQY